MRYNLHEGKRLHPRLLPEDRSWLVAVRAGLPRDPWVGTLLLFLFSFSVYTNRSKVSKCLLCVQRSLECVGVSGDVFWSCTNGAECGESWGGDTKVSGPSGIRGRRGSESAGDLRRRWFQELPERLRAPAESRRGRVRGTRRWACPRGSAYREGLGGRHGGRGADSG